jgi:hypothetical protein
MNLIESLILLAPSVALLLTPARKLDDSDWLFPSISGKTTEISFHSHDRTGPTCPVLVGPDCLLASFGLAHFITPAGEIVLWRTA